MTDRIYLFLGLAKKAGKVVSGDESCEKALKALKAKLIIIAEDASENTVKKYNDMSGYRDTPVRRFGLKEFLGKYSGKNTPRSIVCITDDGFANRLTEMIDNVKR